MVLLSDGPPAARGGSGLPADAAGVADAAFGMRVRALMRFRPIVELDASARRGGRFPDADPTGLALAVIDLVISRQGLPEAVTYGEACDVLTRLSALADPGCEHAEHEALARHVLDSLLNREGHEAKFSYQVGNWRPVPAGGYHRTLTQFWLLQQLEDMSTGRLVLHVDADAINALAVGLQIDVADEQAAAEFVLARQIARGEFAKAEATAQRSLQLTVQYTEELDRVLAETRRDLREVIDLWKVEIPERLTAARAHLDDRLREEKSMLDHLKEVLETAAGAAGTSWAAADAERVATRAAAARASRLLRKCRERHVALLGRVVSAITVFLDAQEAQVFRGLASLRLPDLLTEVLKPMLALPGPDAEQVGQALMGGMSARPRRLPRLADLLADLLAPAPPEPLGDGDPDPDIAAAEPIPPVPQEVIDAAADVVEHVGLPARLSELLAATANLPGRQVPTVGSVPVTPERSVPVTPERSVPVTPERVGRLLASAVLWLHAPDEGAAAGPTMTSQIFGAAALAAVDGRPLPPNLPGGPWYGDDLLVAADEEELLAALPAQINGDMR